MGCGSSQSVKTFYRETLREQETDISICALERGEPEGETGNEKYNKEKTAVTTDSLPYKKSDTKTIPYVPVDDCDLPDTEISVSEVSETSVKTLTLADQRELLMQEEDIM